MRIPLIVAARPTSLEFQCPTVFLRQGKWTFDSTHTDSVLYIVSNGQRVEITETLELFSPTAVRLYFALIGKEPSITIYACLTP